MTSAITATAIDRAGLGRARRRAGRACSPPVRVKMTAMPQLVSLFNAVGGGAAALIAFGDAITHAGSLRLSQRPVSTTLTTFLDVLIGGDHVLRFADRRRQARRPDSRAATDLPRRPSAQPAARAAVALASGRRRTPPDMAALAVLCVLAAAALGLGVLLTLPIGGADMPVVISLLNACTGTAVAMAGFVIDSTPLIIAGALVGAAGGILTKLMADAMNRSIVNIIAGGFGTGD